MRINNQKRNRLILLGLGLIEIGVAAYFWLGKQPTPITLGFLGKSGNQYTVAWKAELSNFESRAFGTLPEALRFVSENLKLSQGRNPLTEFELEHTWSTSRFGAHLVFFKTVTSDRLNQMTFESQDNARYFLNAFRHGAYSPSMFGHSILLVPSASTFN